VCDGLDAFEALFQGDGRFDASIGFVAEEDGPFQHRVDAGEEVQTARDARIRAFIGPRPPF